MAAKIASALTNTAMPRLVKRCRVTGPPAPPTGEAARLEPRRGWGPVDPEIVKLLSGSRLVMVSFLRRAGSDRAHARARYGCRTARSARPAKSAARRCACDE